LSESYCRRNSPQPAVNNKRGDLPHCPCQKEVEFGRQRLFIRNLLLVNQFREEISSPWNKP